MKIKRPSFSLKYSMVTLLSLIILLTIAVKAAEINSKVDLNNDNKIDIVDLSIMLSNFGKLTGLGDANNDNKIDNDDIKLLTENYGKSPTNEPDERSCAADGDRGLLRQMDYANATSLTDPDKAWKSKQVQNAPGIYGAQQTDRLRIVKGQTVPGGQDDIYRPTAAMRVEVRPYDNPANPIMPNPPAGKTYNTAKYPISQADGDVNPIRSGNDYDGSSRSEVILGAEPINVTRWYGYSLFIPADYEPHPTNYLFITQFHDQRNGTASPPEALAIYGSNLRFIMRDPLTTTNAELKKFETPLTPGKWMRIEFGIRFAADDTGWIQMWVNGKQLAANGTQKVTGIETLRMYNGSPDAVYLKQGIYRRVGWTTTQIIHFGPVKVGTNCMDVLP